jgi:hypothetical protein
MPFYPCLQKLHPAIGMWPIHNPGTRPSIKKAMKVMDQEIPFGGDL